jgi:hypothetical protein
MLQIRSKQRPLRVSMPPLLHILTVEPAYVA